MSAATIIAHAFGESADLYKDVLLTERDATSSQLRKAYYKRALLFHPDKQSSTDESELEDTKKKFHAVSVAYNILSEPEKRAEYDDTGELDDGEENSFSGKSGTEQWTEYFRGMFGKVTTDDIEKFESHYKFSDEERDDVIKYYTMFHGDLDKMLECVMLSAAVDKKRWVEDYINPAIQRGDVDDYSVTLNKTLGDDNEQHTGAADDEETESEQDDDGLEKRKPSRSKKSSKTSKSRIKQKSKSNKNSANDDLISKIRGNAVARRERDFQGMMESLEERYAGRKEAGRKKRSSEDSKPPDIPDDEFERIQVRLEAERRNNRLGDSKKKRAKKSKRF